MTTPALSTARVSDKLASAFQWFPWNGSKRWLTRRIAEVATGWRGDGRYIEPFCGGGSVSYELKQLFPSTPQIVSDANPWLMSAFAHQSKPYAIPENYVDVDYWRSLTDEQLIHLDLNARATRFAVCLLTAWGNRWKTEANGAFTSSSTPVNPKFCDPDYLRARLLKFFGVAWLHEQDRAMCCDWKRAVSSAKPGDLVYLDPPYPESLGYGNQWWSFSDQLDVVDWVSNAVTRGVSVIVSNMATLERLYRRAGLQTEIIMGPTANRTKKHRQEVLAWATHRVSGASDG